MIRKIKILGVALVAVAALGVVAASAASASVSHHFEVAEPGETVTAVGLKRFSFEHVTGSNVNNGCDEVSMEGELGETTNLQLTLPSLALGECFTYENGEPLFGMTFVLNGCHFTLTTETTETVTPGEHATFHLVCPEEKPIETRMTVFQLQCSTIPEQTIHGIRYENVTTGDETPHVRAKITAHGIESTTIGACEEEGENTHTDGALETELTFTTPNGISITTTEE